MSVSPQAVKIPERHRLYRGLGGLLELPDSFLRADDKGRRGYTEFGFLSTTEDLGVAVAYSGVEEGRPHAMILELETDSVNRGACVSSLSQYPGGHPSPKTCKGDKDRSRACSLRSRTPETCQAYSG